MQVWADSVMATVGNTKLVTFIRALSYFIPPLRRKVRFLNGLFWSHPRALNNQMHDRKFLTSFYNRWQEEIKSLVPREQLLVFNVKQGWGPLCAFLGVQVPDCPFPRKNDRESVRRYIRGIILRDAWKAVLLLIILACAVWYAAGWARPWL